MFKCAKTCINWKNIKNNLISFIKLYPIIWLMLKSIFNNSFVQVLLLIVIGMFLLQYGKDTNDQTLQTVSITIITASIFKFLLSANAFVTIISKVVRESFVDMDFLKHFQDEKLLDTTTNLVEEITKRNFTNIKEPLTKHITDMLKNKGYYSDILIEIKDSYNKETKLIDTISTYEVTCFLTEDEPMYNKFTFNTELHTYKLIEIKLNNSDITEQISINEKSNIIEYNIALKKGENKIKIVEKYSDSDLVHAIFFNRISSNVKVRFKHDTSIINPIIISRLGETKESVSNKGEIFRNYGEQIFSVNEFIYIKFATKEEK